MGVCLNRKTLDYTQEENVNKIQGYDNPDNMEKFEEKSDKSGDKNQQQQT